MQSKNSQQTKVQGQMTRWLHKGIPLHINKNNNNNNNKNKNKKNLNIYASQTISKNCTGWNTFKLVLLSQHHPHIKIRQRQYKKKNHRPISLMNMMQKYLTKFWQTEFNNTWKGSYITIKCDLFQGFKNALISVNKSLCTYLH